MRKCQSLQAFMLVVEIQLQILGLKLIKTDSGYKVLTNKNAYMAKSNKIDSLPDLYPAKDITFAKITKG
jgi:hypothetical protein